MSHKKNKKKTNRKNLLINILAGFLILLSIALIFNAKLRDMVMDNDFLFGQKVSFS